MLNKVRIFFSGAKLPAVRLSILIFFLTCSSDGQKKVLKEPFPVFRQCFQKSLEFDRSPQIASDNIDIFIFSQGKVYSFQKANLKLNWINYPGGEAVSEFQIIEQKLFIVSRISTTKTGANTSLESTNAEPAASKQVLWTIDTTSGLTVSRAELPDNEKYYLQNFQNKLLAESSSGLILFLDDRGTVENSLETDLNLKFAPVIDGQNIYLIDQQRLFTIDLGTYEKKDGKTIGKAENIFIFPEAVNALLINGAGKIWAGGERGTIYSLDGVSRRLIWKYRAGARIDELKSDGERLLAVSADNFLYLFAAAKGSLKWKKRLENQIAGKTHLSGGRVILQVTDQNTVKSLDLKTGALINSDDFQTVQAADSAKLSNLYDVIEVDRPGELILIESGGLIYFSAGDCPGQNSKH